ncbi:hypothetical protein Tco_1446727 [Tanacetum coccineum]
MMGKGFEGGPMMRRFDSVRPKDDDCELVLEEGEIWLTPIALEIYGGKKEDVGLDELGEGGKGVISKIGEFGGDLGSELLGDRGGEEDERRFIVI